MTSLLGWLDESDVRDVIQLAGHAVPKEVRRVQSKRQARQPTKTRIYHQDSQTNTDVQKKYLPKEFKLRGRPFLEEFFQEHIIDIIANEERYKNLGVTFPSAIVLHGPPGCGKTFAIERLVEFLDWPVYPIDSSSIGSPYIHETSRKVSENIRESGGECSSGHRY